MDSIVYISLAVFLAVIFLLVFLQAKTGNKYKAKNSDMVLGLLSIVLILLMTGKIESLEFDGLSVKTALVEASKEEISKSDRPLYGDRSDLGEESESFSNPGIVTASMPNIRSEPSANNLTIANPLSRNTKVGILDEKDEWYQVEVKMRG